MTLNNVVFLVSCLVCSFTMFVNKNKAHKCFVSETGQDYPPSYKHIALKPDVPVHIKYKARYKDRNFCASQL